jgi:hypothetical protein
MRHFKWSIDSAGWKIPNPKNKKKLNILFVKRNGKKRKNLAYIQTKSFAAHNNLVCAPSDRKIDRNVSNFCLNRFKHLSQPINNIFNATCQIACAFLIISNDIEHLVHRKKFLL